MQAMKIDQCVIPLTQSGKACEKDLENLADLLEDGWIVLGNGTYLPPNKNSSHGSIIFILKKISTTK